MSTLIQEDCICGHSSEYHILNNQDIGHTACACFPCNCNQYKDSYFYSNDGMLNCYGLSCGYIEKAESESKDICIELYKEHNCYHVRGYNFNAHKRLFWEGFGTLSAAKKYYKKQRKVYIV